MGEFVGTALSLGDLLVIGDKESTFGNCLNVDLIAVSFAKWSGAKSYEKIVCIGSSMGGFNAMTLGPLLGAQAVLAIVPQFSVHPEVYPTLQCPHARILRERIPVPPAEWKFKTAEDSLHHNGTAKGKKIHIYIIHGGDDAERQHADKFNHGDNIFHFEIAFLLHEAVPAFLKERKMLRPLLSACADMVQPCVIETIFQRANVPYQRRSPLPRMCWLPQGIWEKPDDE